MDKVTGETDHQLGPVEEAHTQLLEQHALLRDFY